MGKNGSRDDIGAKGVFKFIKRNKDSLVKLLSTSFSIEKNVGTGLLENIHRLKNSRLRAHLLPLIWDKINKIYQDDQHELSQIDISEFLTEIADQPIPLIIDTLRIDECENGNEKKRNICEVLRYILLLVSFCKDVDEETGHVDKFVYQVVGLFDSDPEFSLELWMELAYLEMFSGKHENVQKTIDNALIFFADNSFVINPSEWIEAASRNTFHGQIKGAVIKSICGLGNKNEIELCIKLYAGYGRNWLICKVRAYPNKQYYWIRAIFQPRCCLDNLKSLLQIACRRLPNDTSLREMIQAKIKLENKDYPSAQKLMERVNCDIKWSSLITHEYIQFKDELMERRDSRCKRLKAVIEIDPTNSKLAADVKVLRIKSDLREHIKDYWLHSEEHETYKLLKKAVSLHPDYAEFWSIKGQIEIIKNNLNQAAKTYTAAIKSISNSKQNVGFRIQLAELEQKRGNFQQTRNILKRAISESSSVQPWIYSVLLELELNEKTENAQRLLGQAMIKFPASGELWALAISMEVRDKRGAKAIEALKFCEIDKDEAQYVMLATAKTFFSLGYIEKTRKWFNKIVVDYPNFADAWAYFYKFELMWGTAKRARKVANRFITAIRLANYAYGEKWQKVKDAFENWSLAEEDLLKVIVNKHINMGDI